MNAEAAVRLAEDVQSLGKGVQRLQEGQQSQERMLQTLQEGQQRLEQLIKEVKSDRTSEVLQAAVLAISAVSTRGMQSGEAGNGQKRAGA
jgi:hypothetical protein